MSIQNCNNIIQIKEINMKKGEKAGEIMAGRKREISQVADDQNWRSYVGNELKCAEIWNQDWGFLAQEEGKPY